MAKLIVQEVNAWIDEYIKEKNITSPAIDIEINAITKRIFRHVREEKSENMVGFMGWAETKEYVMFYLMAKKGFRITTGVLSV